MKKALIVIDYTNDFVSDKGALTCGKPGQEIEESIVQWVEHCHQQKDYIVFANDLHKADDPHHPETNLFPPHNIEGTSGRDLYGNVQKAFQKIHHEDHVLTFDKTRYSAFAGTELELRLRERGIEEVILVGVCTDICVLHTAVDAYNKGFKLTVPADAVASFSPQGHEWALGHFEGSLGATVLQPKGGDNHDTI